MNRKEATEVLKSFGWSIHTNAAGDWLGFVPYVSKDYIDRAIAFAQASDA